MVKFGTGDWRAIIGEEFTKENIQKLALAICLKMKAEGMEGQSTVMGYDKRFLSKEAIIWSCEIFGNQGIRVWFVSRSSPIPLIMFYAVKHELSYSMMVTASHNPAIYNGIEVFTYGGGDADEKQAAGIKYYLKQAEELYLPNKEGSGQMPPPSYLELVRKDMVREINPMNEYLGNIVSVINMDAIKERNLHITIDSMYGVSLTVLSTILSITRYTIETINSEHDTLFGGKMPAPTERTLRNLQNYVLNRYCDIGIATNGDADRLGVIDSQGRYLHANNTLVMLYYYLLKYKGWRGPTVCNLITTHVLDKVAESFEQKCYEVSVGFKHVSAKMQETDAIIGGESSGGLTVRDHIRGKNGIYATALLVEMIATSEKRLSEIAADVRKECGVIHITKRDYRFTPEEKERIHSILMEERKLPEMPFKTDHVSYMDGCKVYSKNGGWVTARFSGTEPLLHIFCEVEHEPDTVRVCNLFEEYLGLQEQAGQAGDIRMVIKPHHLMDIIKLYGGRVQVLVPDMDYGHDFYRATNGIIGSHRIQIKVTSGADDICGLCRFLGSDKTYTDYTSHIKGIHSKNSYNKMLDCRIVDILGLGEDAVHTTGKLRRMIGDCPGLVTDVWKGEAEACRETARKRQQLFETRVRKYLDQGNEVT